MKTINLIIRFITDQIKGRKENRGNSLRFRNYYLTTDDDKRSTFAKVFDYSIWRIILFFILFVFICLKINQLYISIFITLITITILNSMVIRSRNRKYQQIKEEKRRYIGSQKIYNEIINKTMDEMEKYVKDIFTPTGFSDFELIEKSKRYILLKSLYKEHKVMMLFNVYGIDFDVQLKEVKEFVCTIIDKNIYKGILVTTSNFTNDSYDFINTLGENYNLLLVNKEQFLNIIKKNGFFPKDEEIDEIIESKISKRGKKWIKYKRTILSKNKIRGYIILSIYLILTAWYTPYTIYYVIVASIILALAFITFIFHSIYNSETDKEESVDFEELLNNM